MRKTKQIKRKEVIYSIEEWEEIKRLAEIASLKTGTYIKRISLNGKINVIDLNEVTPVMNALRIIGNNINQIARSVNAGIAKPDDAKHGLYMLDRVYELMYQVAKK